MGTDEYGIYDYANAIGILGAFVAGFGLPTAVLQFIPAYKAQEKWAYLRGIIWRSWKQSLIVSLLISLCSTVILLRLDTAHILGEYNIPLIFGTWTIPIVTLVSLQKEIIRAFQKIVLAYAPSLIIQPLFLMGLAAVWQLRQDFTSIHALTLSLLSAFLALALQWLLFQQSLDTKIRNVRPTYEINRWWKVALPLMLFSGSHMLLSQTDTLMIGAFLSAKEVGIYSAALKTSSWVPFILSSVNAISAPMISSLYAQGDRLSLQQLVSTIARWMFYPALATAVGLMGFAEPILQLFGSEFVAAKGALMILILGQLVNVGAGSVGYLMTMTGHQTQSALVMLVSALVNVILNFIGIHFLGIVGAALATSFSMAMWNIWLYILVARQLDVRPSILDAYR